MEKFGIVDHASKKAEREARFGFVAAATSAVPNGTDPDLDFALAGSAPTETASGSEHNSKVAERQKRFGTTGGSIASSGSLSSKIAERQKKFGGAAPASSDTWKSKLEERAARFNATA